MKIETRIRQTASRKVKVAITKRRKSASGFRVVEDVPRLGKFIYPARTRKEGIAKLLTKLRCMEQVTFSLEVCP